VAEASWRLVVAGVAGGVGTSTWSRIVARAWPRLQVTDGGVYRGGLIDVLVTSTTATATGRLAAALAACPRPPILVVMQTVPYRTPAPSRALLRRALPHVAQLIEVGHQRTWLSLETPPGKVVPKATAEAVRGLAAALTAMYGGGPTATPAPPATQVSRVEPSDLREPAGAGPTAGAEATIPAVPAVPAGPVVARTNGRRHSAPSVGKPQHGIRSEPAIARAHGVDGHRGHQPTGLKR
jgi:hypothetical protein